MADHTISIVTISDKIIFNENHFIPFETFTIEDTRFLFGTLFLNLIDNIAKIQDDADIIIYADNHDIGLIQTELANLRIEKFNLFFYQDDPDLSLLFTKIKSHQHSIILYADVMGISLSSIKEILNLLNTDENTIVIGKSMDSSICLIGFNHQSESLLKTIQFSERDYSKLLSLLKTEEYFLHTLTGFVRVRDTYSFKVLYNNLSQKKSIEYCSQEMHEKFTHLFVEYKDLLK